jgi:hypothetical protein
MFTLPAAVSHVGCVPVPLPSSHNTAAGHVGTKPPLLIQRSWTWRLFVGAVNVNVGEAFIVTRWLGPVVQLIVMADPVLPSFTSLMIPIPWNPWLPWLPWEPCPPWKP